MRRQGLAARMARSFDERLAKTQAGFERRPGQVEMAVAVASALEDERIAVIEAETGLGKSLAYLVPLVEFVSANHARAVVSTYTHNLQRQLIDKDLPLALSSVGIDVDVSVLMGRGNYVCRRGVGRLLEKGDASPALRKWLARAMTDATGEIEAVPGASLVLDSAARAAISCPTRETVCAGCRQRNDCFLFAARKRAIAAQIVVANHALLFSDLAASGALLGPYDALVVDEAHHLADVATKFFTVSYTPRSVRDGAESVYAPEYEERIQYARAMISDDPSAETRVARLWGEFQEAMEKAHAGSRDLFGRVSANLDAGWNSGTVIYGEGSPLLYESDVIAAEVARGLTAMAAAADEIAEILDGFEVPGETALAAPARALRDAAEETAAAFEFVYSGSSEDHVFYARGEKSRRAARVTELSAAPIDVSVGLGTMIEEGPVAAVLTSATLAVGGDFDFTLERVGLTASARTDVHRFETPFDLDEQRAVAVAGFLPDPSDATFLDAAAEVVARSAEALQRRVLVLCTARTQIPVLVDGLRARLGASVELFTQDRDSSRSDLLARFTKSRRGILIGLASFWEGVDLPGEALELVAIVKLPFLVPTEPLVAARRTRIEQRGENPFEKLFLPDVVLRLKQGIGRLIRTGRDRGAVLLLDRRLCSSHYGDFVLGAAVGGGSVCGTIDETIARLKRIFEDRES